MILPKLIGKAAYVLGYPFIMLWLRNTKRAYVIIRVNNQVLVTKNWLGLHVKWRLPGGGIRKDEDIIDGLVREVQEEISVKLDTASMQILNPKPMVTKPGYEYYVYTLTLPVKPDIHYNKHELASAEWRPIEQLHQDQLSVELKTGLSLLK